MNRIVRVSAVFAVVAVLIAGLAFAQGQRSIMERKAWYVDGDGKVHEMLYWRIFMGDYDNVKLKRTFPGHGQIEVSAGMNFQFLSSGYIEGNGASVRGKIQSLPGMRIRAGGDAQEIKLEDIDYIYDYGTRVATKDGRKGEFLINAEGTLLEVKRFQLTEYKLLTGSFGEPELKDVKDRVPIIGLSFTKEGAQKASQESVSN
jgi:hypothetical protein